MSEAVECDYCNEILQGRWLHVEWTGLDPAELGDDSGPWDFCDVLCMSGYWNFDVGYGRVSVTDSPYAAEVRKAAPSFWWRVVSVPVDDPDSRSAPPHPL